MVTLRIVRNSVCTLSLASRSQWFPSENLDIVAVKFWRNFRLTLSLNGPHILWGFESTREYEFELEPCWWSSCKKTFQSAFGQRSSCFLSFVSLFCQIRARVQPSNCSCSSSTAVEDSPIRPDDFRQKIIGSVRDGGDDEDVDGAVAVEVSGNDGHDSTPMEATRL